MMEPKKIVVVGATSSIAMAAARLWAKPGVRMHLVARNAARLAAVAADLEARGAVVSTTLADLASANPAALIPGIMRQLGDGVDVALVAHGILPGDETRTDMSVAAEVLNTNLVSATLWALPLAEVMKEAGAGRLVLVSSVAGDRGRQGNIVYNASKAGLTALGEGLAHWLAPFGVKCIVVKPGPTVTPMTEGFAKREGLMWSTPEKVAADIVKAVRRGHGLLGSVSVYSPWFWRYIMLIIRHVPSVIFHKTKI
jgi:short-subunit dehydrogenase